MDLPNFNLEIFPMYVKAIGIVAIISIGTYLLFRIFHWDMKRMEKKEVK